MRGWMEERPKSYWLSCFFFPQGFLTAVKQTFARKTKTPIDTIEFFTNLQTFYKENVSFTPEHGVIIHGLFLEGCRWDMKTMML